MNLETEQEFRDRLHRAMADCDQIEAETMMVRMKMGGIQNPDVIAYNIFFDIDEKAREWWLQSEPGPGGYRFASVVSMVRRINEAAKGEAND